MVMIEKLVSKMHNQISIYDTINNVSIVLWGVKLMYREYTTELINMTEEG